MTLVIVVSRADEASAHVGEHLRDLVEWTEHADPDRPDADGGGTVYRTGGSGEGGSDTPAGGGGDDTAELREFDDLHLHIEGAADAFGRVADGERWEPTLLAFASRHSGETGPLLTAHTTGNFGPAEYGGDDDELAEAAPNAIARVHAAFREHAPEGYDVGLECTHHGPSEVGCPSLFVELGSGEDEWRDPGGARAVARSILALRGVDPRRERTLVGFGGGHYVPRFERVVRETDWAVGHVAADWGLAAMGDPETHRGVLRQAFERSGAEHALLDGDHPDLSRVLSDLGYRVVSETWVRETDGVPLDLVTRVEDALGTVEDGVRFGGAAVGYDGDVVPDRLPDALLDEADGVDRDRTRAAVAERAVAYATAEGGTRVAGPIALAAPDDREALVDALLDVLREKYDVVEREGHEAVARRETFDPAAAAELGVPQGPAFGELADGQAVEVDGREVRPEEVRTTEEVRIPLS